MTDPESQRRAQRNWGIVEALEAAKVAEQEREWHDRPAPRAAARKKADVAWNKVSELSKEI